MSNKKVVVIGAGGAGLSAAYNLWKEGIDFVVLEADSTYGGRCKVRNFDPDHPEYYITRGPVWSENGERMTQEYLEEFDLNDQYVPSTKQVMGIYFKGENHWLSMDGNFAHALGSIKGMPAALVPQGAKFMKNFLKAKKLMDQDDGSEDYVALVNEVSKYDAQSWIVKNGGEEVADKLLAPIVGTIVQEDLEGVSVIQPLAIMARLDGVGQIKGGHNAINTKLFECVKDNVRFNTRVQEIVIEDGAVRGVKIEGGEFIEADDVICCSDAYDARAMLPNIPGYVREALETVEYSKSWCYTFKLSRKLGPDYCTLFMIAPSSGSKLITLFEENRNDVCSEPGTGLLRVFTGTPYDDYWCSLSDEDRLEAVKQEAYKIVPELEEVGECIDVVRYDRALNTQPAGQFDALYAMEKTYKQDVKGLHLAGEYRKVHCSIEGAYASGKHEALAVAAKLK